MIETLGSRNPSSPDFPLPAESAPASVRSPSLLERTCRAALHRALGGLQRARLTVRDADGATSFGSTAAADDPVATVTVLDPSFYTACALRGVVGAGEAWMDGAWQADDLTAVIRTMARNRAALEG
ncbi:MAG: hypothetical protein ABR538_02915, partial [Candidatus Binatia bacterium]